MEMEKMAGKDLSLLMSHRVAISPKNGIVMLQVTLDNLPEPITIALQPEQARRVSDSLLDALARLQSIQ